jgi:hypothetical protein
MSVDGRLSLIGSSVIYERFGEEVVAIHTGTGRYYSLPGLAGEAFLLLEKSPTVAELTAALARKYDAPESLIRADLGSFFQILEDESLIASGGVGASGSNADCLEDFCPSGSGLLPYQAPIVDAHRNLENLFLVDPIHETAQAGWPHVRPAGVSDDATLRYRVAADRCLFEQFEEATIALNLNTGAYFSFSGSAEDILLLVNEQPTVAEIVQALATKYTATADQLQAAVEHFLERLIQTDMVVAEALEDGHAPTRELVLARPGTGLVFPPPEMAMYRDAPAVAPESTGARHTLISAKKRFRLNREETIVAQTSDGAVAIQLIRGVYFVLNRTAARVLSLLERTPSANEIVAALEAEYDVRRPELVASVIVLLQNFVGIGVAVAEAIEDEQAPAAAIEPAAAKLPFETFSVDMRHDFRDQLCLYPGGKPTAAEQPSRGRQLAAVLEEYFRETSAKVPATETKLRVAGRNLCLLTIGDRHATDLGLALSHLRHDFNGEADLTIHVWDGETAGAASNSLLASYLQTLYRDWTGSCGTRGELRGFHSPAVPAFYMPGPDILNLVDLKDKRAFFLKRDASPLPYWEAGSPFRAILHTWLSADGMQFVHGGAVGDRSGGLLLAGRGGSGKSTTTLLCLNDGMLYAGDDYCALDLRGEAFVHSLYNTAKLMPEDVDRFPNLRDRIWNPQVLETRTTDKATFFLGDVMPERMSAGFPIRALLIPRVQAQVETTLTPCGPVAALAAIAPSTVAQLPIAGQVDMERLARLAESVPAYYLNLGSDLTLIPAVVRSVLR